ncbi:TRAP transporter large permease [Nitratireductor basaltis]|uniref:TRAP transporter large permease protein n=1 Tax=Nitratireductor basaltis TaxID=472175 RepID=A0A084U5C7_9HYPH|nr:TRAP transporter large permease [Nitratireductor basaltis]KFB08163.1 DctM-like transporter protein [Nitratireductor basaltis]
MDYLPVVILLVLLAFNIQVAFAIGIAALSFFLLSGAMPVQVFIQRLIASTQSFPLLAVPFFILTGAIMNEAGITRRMLNLAESLTGHMTGGLAQVNVLLSTLLSGMSGSANADTAVQSKLLVPEMERRGYDVGYSAAVTASSSVIAATIPPGIGLILYGFLGNVSIGSLFLAGVIPGLMLAVLLMITAWIIARRRGYKPSREKPASWAERLTALRGAALALLIPVGVVGGIRFGLFTATEAGAIAVIYATVIGLMYRGLRWSSIPKVIVETVLATAAIMLIICAANAFGFYMSWVGIPKQAAAFMVALTDNPIILLLLINILLLVVGMLIEGTALLILLTPILVPVAVEMGIDPVHFGIVMVLNLTLGGMTPPLGTLMFVACSVTGVSIAKFVREALPFLAVLILALLLVTYVPQISLWLPTLGQE